MLRTIFILTIIIFGVGNSLRGPFQGLLFYLWLAYFRPDTWTWYDFVTRLNFSLIAGIYVIIASLFSSDRFRLGVGPVLLLMFLAQSLSSTLQSSTFDYAWIYCFDFIKIVAMGFLIYTLVNTEERFRWTLLTITLSLGFEAVKQGYAQFFLNPGGKNGNEIPFLGDNNGVAVGMFMLIPIVVALSRTSSTWFERYGHRFAAVGLVYRGLATYSRGGFLTAGAIAMHYILRSKRKVTALVATVLVAAVVTSVLPTEFWDRMSTIEDAAEDIEEADASIQSRIHFWQVAVVMANDRPFTGVGHNSFNVHYDSYDFSFGRYRSRRSVHSSWFGLLAEVGYPGLFLFLLILGLAFWKVGRVTRLAKRHPELKNLGLYASALEAALLAFCVGGTFVIFQYNEMLWHFFALSFTVNRLAEDKLAAAAAVQPAAAAVGPRLPPMVVPRPVLPPKSRAS